MNSSRIASPELLLKLTEADLKDLVPLIVVRTEVRDIRKEVQRFNMIGNYLGVPSCSELELFYTYYFCTYLVTV